MGAALRTPAQNSRIWGTVAELGRRAGLEREDLDVLVRRICREISGQEHTSRLTIPQAARLIQALEREVEGYSKPRPSRPHGRAVPEDHEPWGARQPGPRKELPITEFQQQLIGDLYDLVGWDQARRRGFSARQCKVPWPQTQAQADAIIEPLQAIALRGLDHAAMRRRVESLARQPSRLDAWKRNFVADLIRQYEEAQDISTVMSTHKLAKVLEAEAWARRGGA